MYIQTVHIYMYTLYICIYKHTYMYIQYINILLYIHKHYSIVIKYNSYYNSNKIYYIYKHYSTIPCRMAVGKDKMRQVSK